MKRWEQRIAEATERGTFTAEDRSLSGDWVTCACGQQDPRIERYKDRAPRDEILQTLGWDFYAAVRANDFDEATSILADIESRSAQLISKEVAS